MECCSWQQLVHIDVLAGLGPLIILPCIFSSSDNIGNCNCASFFLVTAGRIPRNNGIPWRGNSGLKDGSDAKDVKGGLVGGYYDAGDNIKFHFPMAFSMTLLSWSVIEYSAKYKAVEEYDHVRELIRWGADYLLHTFNSSASTIDHVYAQVITN